jgi:hypothetical protein
MAVGSAVGFNAFTGNGTTVTFAFAFTLLDADDLIVTVNDSTVSNYTVSGLGNPAGGSITFAVAPANASAVVLRRSIALVRETDYQSNGDLQADTLNEDFDRLWLAVQQGAGGVSASIRAPGIETLSNLPAAADRLDLMPVFDAATGDVEVSTFTATQVASAVSAAYGTGATADASTYLPAGTGAVAHSVQSKLRERVSAKDFGAVADGSDQTAEVQLAIDSLGSDGGEVDIPIGTKFDLQDLVFPLRCNLTYFMDDDNSRPNPSTTLGTNEQVTFAANANGAGIVNEWRHTAAFHPGLVVDVRRDVPGHDAEMGAGQVRVPTSSNPARASINIHDQQVDTWRTVYEVYGGDYSQFTGTSMHAWRRKVVVTGVGTGAGGWVSTPSVGTLITGGTSGAQGWFLSAASNTTTILWLSGKFAAGDTLIDNNETTVNTASSVAFTVTSMQPLSQGLMRGNWGIGLPNDSPRDVFAVGGGGCAMPTRDFGQHVESTITDPYWAWADAVADVPTNGYRIIYDTVAAAAARRLWLTKYSSATKLAPIGITKAKAAFSDSSLVETSAVNIASVSNTATGKYLVTFTNAFARADYAVTFGNSDKDDRCIYVNRTTTTVEVWNYVSGSLADLEGEVSMVCTGGDI